MMATSKKHVFKNNFAVQSKYEPFYTGGQVHCTDSGEHLFCTCSSKLTVLNTSDGQILKTLSRDDDDEVLCFAVSSSSDVVVTSLKSGLLRQWDWKNDTVIRTWKSLHTGPISCMTLDSTDILLATGGADSTIKMWDLSKQYCTHNLKGGQGVYSVVRFHPDIKKLQVFGAATDNAIRVWDLNTSRCIAVLEGHFSTVTSLSFSAEDDIMLSSSRDKVVIVWNMVEFQQIKTIPVFESVESLILLPKDRKIPELNISSANMHFCTAGEKGILKVWELRSGRLVHAQENTSTDNLDGTAIVHAAYVSGTDSIVTVTYEHHIQFHSLEGFNLTKQFVGYNDEILDIKYFGEKENYIAMATNSSIIKIFEASTFSCQLLNGHKDIVLSIDIFAKDPFMFCSGSKDNTVLVWKMSQDTGDVQCVFHGHGHTHSVQTVSCSKLSTSFLVSGSQDTTLKLWKVPSKVPLVAQVATGAPLKVLYTEKAHEKDINSTAISPNDKLIATGSQDKTIKIWKATDLSPIGTMRGHRKGIWCVEFSPVDQVLASSSADGTIKIWALSDYACLKTFEGHECSVLKVAFVSTGMQLLSVASDGNMKLWTIKLNECVKTFDEHKDKVWTLALSKTEDFVLTGGSDSTLIIWKDVTLEEKEEADAKREELILKDQELKNLLLKKKWAKALQLAITLEQPYQALKIIKEILIEPEGQQELMATIEKMRPDQIDAMLKFATTWNTNSKFCEAAQAVLSVVLQLYLPEELLKFPSIRENVEGLLPYTERHFQRLKRLNQQATFIDYMWQNMHLMEKDDVSEPMDVKN